MKTSLSFLATDIKQLPRLGKYGNDGVEAAVFSVRDLENDNWQFAWSNISKACAIYGPTNVTYHFPMNGSDYVEEAFVFKRLIEAFQRANDLGLAGVVVHSNRIKAFDEWLKLTVPVEQKRVIEKLCKVSASVKNRCTWLGLENMPTVGNSGYEMDPLFCFSSDFNNLPEEIGVVWDICHSTTTVAYMEAYRTGKLTQSQLIRQSNADYYDFMNIIDRILHWHFAAFKGLNDPGRGLDCTEGINPIDSTLGVDLYAELIGKILKTNTIINFEVEERDYTDRKNGPHIISWAQKCLKR